MAHQQTKLAVFTMLEFSLIMTLAVEVIQYLVEDNQASTQDLTHEFII